MRINSALFLRGLLNLVLIVALAGCSTGVTLPEVDLSAPGWTVWSGQALWKPGTDRPAIAGEILLARHNGGDVLISFAKPPVPIFTAQTSAMKWKIDFVYTQRSHSGSAGPPIRFVWFQIPSLLQGASTPNGWQVQTEDDATWELHNPDSGEHIRLVLDL